MSQPILATAKLHGPMASPVAPPAASVAQVPVRPWCLVAAYTGDGGDWMAGTYLKYSRYNPDVLEYFFWNIFFGMFWNIFGKGYLIPPPRTIPGIFLALSWPYTWNIFEYISSDCLTYLGMKYHVVCRQLQYLHRNPSRSRQPDMTAWFC